MNIEKYESLPEGLSKGEVAELVEAWRAEIDKEELAVSLKKLGVLSDKQWHTYELPSQEVSIVITDWLNSNYCSDSEFLEEGLGACYCFGLSKTLFKKFLSDYDGDARAEYENYLSLSKGECIDPYSTLRDQ